MGFFRFRHRDAGKFDLEILSLEDMRRAVELLPTIFDHRLVISATWDSDKRRYVPKK